MTELDATQLSDLARCLNKLGQALTDYSIEHWDTLSDEALSALSEHQNAVFRQAQQVVNRAVQVRFEEAASHLERLKVITHEIRHTVVRIHNAEKVIAFAGTAASLAANIASGNGLGIVNNIGSLGSQVGDFESVQDEPDQETG